MNRTNKHFMTLRLPTDLNEQIAQASHDRRLTKSAWIRAAIRQTLKSRTSAIHTGESTCKLKSPKPLKP